MSLNYAFGFSLFLLLLVMLNVYFFYTMNKTGNKHIQFQPHMRADPAPSLFREIYEHHHYLPPQYRVKNSKFAQIQRNLISAFNYSSSTSIKDVWPYTENWTSETSLYPNKDKMMGLLLQAIEHSTIVLVDNAPKGTQLKLLLLLENKQKIYFKPKRYDLTHIVRGNIYAGFDRHNSEVFAYYTGVVLNFTWIAPATIRKLNVQKDIIPYATLGLKKTMLRNGSGSVCIFGKCLYCKRNETVCGDKGEIEGAAILYLDQQFKVNKSPWRRSYSTKKMEWETDDEFCKKAMHSLSPKRLLNLIDIAIFDFLIQNGDRHRYEVYKDKVVILDNGKGLGNPDIDELDILAPLYQCCLLRASTWRRLEMISGGSLTETIRTISTLHKQNLATEDHYKAVERRLLKVYATVQYCIAKLGSAKVFRPDL